MTDERTRRAVLPCLDCGGHMSLERHIVIVDEPNDVYVCDDCGRKVHVHELD